MGLKIIWLAATAPLKILVVLKRALTLATAAYNLVLRALRASVLAASIAMGIYDVRGRRWWRCRYCKKRPRWPVPP
ncbi:hypothetical protein O0544_17090 [Edwardsiella anguillarum]|nr:hypothetical protein [Edwardsiella anguillarum]